MTAYPDTGKSHAWDCWDGPAQGSPPLLGVGFMQLRVRFCSPFPQFLLQVPHELQLDQPPMTIIKKINEWNDETQRLMYEQANEIKTSVKEWMIQS